MSIIAKIISSVLRRKCIFFALSLLFLLLNAFGASSHDNSVGITRTLLKTGEVEQRVYLTSSDAAIKAPGLVTGSLEVVAQKVTDITSLGSLLYSLATDSEVRSDIKQQFHDIKEQIGEDPQELFPVLRDVILVVATGNTPEEWDKSLNSPDSGERSHLATRGTGNAIVAVASGAAIIKDLPEIAQELGKRVGKSSLFKGARQKAIAQFGKEAEDLIYIKFNKDGGAAAEIMAHFGQEGFDALKKVDNIDDAAKVLVKGKMGYRYIGSQANYIEEIKKTGIIPPMKGNDFTYFSLEKYDNPNEAISKLQLNEKKTDAAWCAEFSVDQINTSVVFPKANWNDAPNIEVITRSYPQYGEGGASQFVTQESIKLKRLINLKTGEIIIF